MRTAAQPAIGTHDVTPPVPLPEGHIGPVVLPGTNRHIWWTGRVAIGLRYERNAQRAAVGESALWVQDLMLASRREGARHPGIHQV